MMLEIKTKKALQVALSIVQCLAKQCDIDTKRKNIILLYLYCSNPQNYSNL